MYSLDEVFEIFCSQRTNALKSVGVDNPTDEQLLEYTLSYREGLPMRMELNDHMMVFVRRIDKEIYELSQRAN